MRREDLTNPTGPEPEDETFAEDLAPETPDSIRQAQTEATETASAAKDVVNKLPDFSSRSRGPFKAVGGQQAEPSQRLVAHKTTDYEIWNRLIGKATGEE